MSTLFLTLTLVVSLHHVLGSDCCNGKEVLSNDCCKKQEFKPTEYGPQTPETAENARKALHGKHIGGDMLPGFQHVAGIKPVQYRWPGYPGAGVVPYTISSDFDNSDEFKNNLAKAIQQYQQRTCITFVPRTDEQNYINFIKGNGCYSSVGNVGNGAQEVSIGNGCDYVGTIIHELGHAIGLEHMHQRSDRDNYIDINYNNVNYDADAQFGESNADDEIISTPYEYQSIMHYGDYAFSVLPGRRRTLVPKDGSTLLDPYDKPGLTDLDVQDINYLYGC